MCQCTKGLGNVNTPNFAQYLTQDKTSFEFTSPDIRFKSDDLDGTSLVYVLVGGLATLALVYFTYRLAKES